MIKQTAIMLCALGTLIGCASTLTQDERELKHAIAAENWAICEMIYKNHSRRYIISSHVHMRHRRHRYSEVMEDLADNNCRMVLGDYWITQ